jgi:hypothetical protein
MNRCTKAASQVEHKTFAPERKSSGEMRTGKHPPNSCRVVQKPPIFTPHGRFKVSLHATESSVLLISMQKGYSRGLKNYL